MSDHKQLPLIDYPKNIKDEYGYPTEESLEYILNWGYKMIDDKVHFGAYFAEVDKYDLLINFLFKIWAYPDYISYDGYELELHTGGLLGNEDIIELLKNTSLWRIHWYKTLVGGHYFFNMNKKKKPTTFELVKMQDFNGKIEFYVKVNGKILDETKTNIEEHANEIFDFIKNNDGKIKVEELLRKEESE